MVREKQQKVTLGISGAKGCLYEITPCNRSKARGLLGEGGALKDQLGVETREGDRDRQGDRERTGQGTQGGTCHHDVMM